MVDEVQDDEGGTVTEEIDEELEQYEIPADVIDAGTTIVVHSHSKSLELLFLCYVTEGTKVATDDVFIRYRHCIPDGTAYLTEILRTFR